MEGRSWKPYVAMICLQFGYAGMNIVSKVSLDRGLSHFVLVVYRQAFATAITAPLALLLERKVRPTITLPIFMHMFVLGLLGPVIDQNLYYSGLKFTSPTVSCAVTNFLPVITFLMAALFRMEKVEIRKTRCQAKVLGSVLIVAGALVMVLLHNGHGVRSVLLILASTLAWASFCILQATTLSKFPAPLSLTAIVCALGTLQSSAVAFVMEPNPSVWGIGFDIDLFAVAYAGIVSSGIAYYVQGLVVEIAGPVFVTSFNPLMTIIVAIMGTLILGDKIYFGGITGATLMVMGVCFVLWGKHKEMIDSMEEEQIPEAIKGDNHSRSLPTIFEDVEANTCSGVETPRMKLERAALTQVVVVPLGCHILRPAIGVEAPKLQSSLRIVSQERADDSK